jgi:hypothetical protein
VALQRNTDGYPHAHEDDAERAVRAGLAVIEAVGKLPAREDLSVRLGIATGLTVVGDLIGEGAAQERGVVGETPNLAARLQGLAAPSTLIIGEATRRQIGLETAVRLAFCFSLSRSTKYHDGQNPDAEIGSPHGFVAPLTSFWLLAVKQPRLSSVESTWEVESEIYGGDFSVCIGAG